MKKFKDLRIGDKIYYFPKSQQEPTKEYTLSSFRCHKLNENVVDLMLDWDRSNKLIHYLTLTKNQVRALSIVRAESGFFTTFKEFGFYKDTEWIKHLEI